MEELSVEVLDSNGAYYKVISGHISAPIRTRRAGEEAQGAFGLHHVILGREIDSERGWKCV